MSFFLKESKEESKAIRIFNFLLTSDVVGRQKEN